MQIVPEWVSQAMGGPMAPGAIVPEIVLCATGLLILMADLFVPRGSKRWLAAIAFLGIIVAIASLRPWAPPPSGSLAFGGLYVLDAFGSFFKYLLLIATFLTVLMSASYLDEERAQHGEFYALLCFATLGMMFMVAGNDLVTIFVGLELMALSTYVLVGFLKTNPRSNEAAMKYFIVGAFGSAFFLYGISLFYGAAGTTRLYGVSGSELTATLGQALAGKLHDTTTVMALIMLSVGLAFKVAAVPFHAWAPDVYEGAPTPVTAYISVASKAAGFAVVLRVLLVGLYGMQSDWHDLLWVLAVLSMTLGNAVAILQSNTKRLLAYSSIAHAGNVLVALVAARAGNEDWAVTAALLYLFAYTFMNVGAFALIAALRRKDIIGDDIKDFSGLGRRCPWAAVAMSVFLLSLGGIPPTAGFIGKLFVFMAAVKAGEGWLAVIAVLNAAVAVYYYFRIIVAMWMTEARDQVPYAWSATQIATIAIAAVATLGIGLWPGPFIELARHSLIHIVR